MQDFKKMNQKEFEDFVFSKGKDAALWYVNAYAEKVPTEVYPRIKNAEGKSVVDKTQPPKIELRPKSFIALKSEFAAKFAPELAPKAKKTETQESHLDALKARLAAM